MVGGPRAGRCLEARLPLTLKASYLHFMSATASCESLGSLIRAATRSEARSIVNHAEERHSISNGPRRTPPNPFRLEDPLAAIITLRVRAAPIPRVESSDYRTEHGLHRIPELPKRDRTTYYVIYASIDDIIRANIFFL